MLSLILGLVIGMISNQLSLVEYISFVGVTSSIGGVCVGTVPSSNLTCDWNGTGLHVDPAMSTISAIGTTATLSGLQHL